jgi:hypothetical protein
MSLDGKMELVSYPDERPKDFFKPILILIIGKKLECLPIGN